MLCSGDAFDWSISIDGANAEMNIGFLSRMELMSTTEASDAEWPQALTFVGRQDTAIVILDRDACETDTTASHSALVLTQRGQTPILLTGCCISPK